MKPFHVLVLVFTLFVFLMPACSQTQTVLPDTSTVEPELTPSIEPLVLWPSSVSDLPNGELLVGNESYTAYGCIACHGQIDSAYSNVIGPWLGNIAERAGTPVLEYSSSQYIYESVLNPNKRIASDCPTGECESPSLMPHTFSKRLSKNEMASVVLYLTTETQ